MGRHSASVLTPESVPLHPLSLQSPGRLPRKGLWRLGHSLWVVTGHIHLWVGSLCGCLPGRFCPRVGYPVLGPHAVGRLSFSLSVFLTCMLHLATGTFDSRASGWQGQDDRTVRNPPLCLSSGLQSSWRAFRVAVSS